MKVREVIEKDGYALVPLTRGYYAMIDIDDAEKISKYNWSASVRPNGIIYAVRGYKESGKQTTVYMHRAVFGECESEIDHINGNKLDNRKTNLRKADHFQNGHNRGRPRNNKSGYKGVSWCMARGCYQVFITSYGHKKFLGHFMDPAEGHAKYVNAANDLHKDFARSA